MGQPVHLVVDEAGSAVYLHALSSEIPKLIRPLVLVCLFW